MSFAPDPADPTVTAPEESIASVIAADNKSTLHHAAHRNYSFAAAAWLAVLAIPLLAFPRVLSLIFGSLLTPTGTPEAEGAAEVIRQLNPLERSLAGLTGLSCLTLAAMLVIQTGAVPLTSSISTTSTADALFRIPTVLTTTFYFSGLAWWSYDLGFWLVAGPSALLSAWGLWAIMFANESQVNKVGGANTTSSFPFKNAHAEADKKDL